VVELDTLVELTFESPPQSTFLHMHFGECAVMNAVKRWLAGVVVIIVGWALAVVGGDDDDVDGGDGIRLGFEAVIPNC